MSKESVDKFLELMQADEGLARRMAACLYMLENGGGASDGSGGFIAREIVPLAKEYGFEFTAQDFLDYTNEATAKAGLRAEDLAEVSGGKGGVRAALMGTLALLGVASAPVAMKMVSGGEVSPFSMVASAAEGDKQDEQATPERLEELQLGIADLKSLKGTISSSKLEKKEKDMLSRRCVSFLNKGEESLKSELKKDVEQSVKDIAGFVDYLRSQSVTNNWSKRRETLATLEKRISLLEGKAFLNQQEIANLRNIANTLKKNLIELKKEQGKGKKATGTNANDFEAKIKSFEDILAQAEKLNKNKDKLVKKLSEKKDDLPHKIALKIDAQIAVLNDEIKDFTPKNIEAKAEAFYAIIRLSQKLIEVDSLQKKVDKLLIIDEFANKNDNKTSLEGIKTDLGKVLANLILDSDGIALNKVKFSQDKETRYIQNISHIEQKVRAQQLKADKAQQKNDTIHMIATVLAALREQESRLDERDNAVLTCNPRRTESDIAAVKNVTAKLRERIKNFGDVTYKNVWEKRKEILSIKEEIDDLVNAHNKFMHEHMLFPENKNKVKTLLACFKKLCNDKDQLDKIKEHEQELNAMKKTPDNYADLLAALTRLRHIKTSIPQIKATLDKATNLKKIAEQVNADLAKVFDNIIKEIEAAGSVEKVNSAAMKLDNSEKTLRGLMRTEINEANKTAHILHEIAKIFGLNQLKGNFVDLIDTFDGFNYVGAPIDEIYKVYQDIETVKIAENELKNYLGKQIDDLVKQANELKEKAQGVDNKIKNSFKETENSLRAEKENLLKKLDYAARTVSTVRESLAERQGELLPKIALKNQIATLKEQATKLAELLKGKGIINNVSEASFSTIKKALEKINLSDRLNNITKKLAEKKHYMNDLFEQVYQQLVAELELDALLENEVMGAEIQDELKAIKAGLPKADEANADTVVKAFDDVKAAKTKMANKLLEWHKILSEYHNKGYHKEGVEEVQSLVETNLETLEGGAKKMLANENGVKLDVATLNEFAQIALKIADNLRMDITNVIDTVEGYNGFGEFDFTAGTQANTLVTFLRDKVGDAHALKFVDKKTRAKLATDIKHIFDQIKIDQKTGKYYLSGFYNQLGAVNHNDLKLICEAYDVVADDFGERVVYRSPKEGKGLTFKDQADVLVQALSQVQRLDLFDVSPESREALKNDILEIGAKIKSTPGWIYGRTLSLEGVDQKETKNMQGGLEKILEFYNSIQAQMKVKK